MLKEVKRLYIVSTTSGNTKTKFYRVNKVKGLYSQKNIKFSSSDKSSPIFNLKICNFFFNTDFVHFFHGKK